MAGEFTTTTTTMAMETKEDKTSVELKTGNKIIRLYGVVLYYKDVAILSHFYHAIKTYKELFKRIDTDQDFHKKWLDMIYAHRFNCWDTQLQTLMGEMGKIPCKDYGSMSISEQKAFWQSEGLKFMEEYYKDRGVVADEHAKKQGEQEQIICTDEFVAFGCVQYLGSVSTGSSGALRVYERGDPYRVSVLSRCSSYISQLFFESRILVIPS